MINWRMLLFVTSDVSLRMFVDLSGTVVISCNWESFRGPLPTGLSIADGITPTYSVSSDPPMTVSPVAQHRKVNNICEHEYVCVCACLRICFFSSVATTVYLALFLSNFAVAIIRREILINISTNKREVESPTIALSLSPSLLHLSVLQSHQRKAATSVNVQTTAYQQQRTNSSVRTTTYQQQRTKAPLSFYYVVKIFRHCRTRCRTRCAHCFISSFPWNPVELLLLERAIN